MELLSDFDYVLPERLIAQVPLADRTASRLLHLDRQTAAVQHLRFADVRHLLRPGDLLVLNNTRVTAIRLIGTRPSGGKIEALLLHELEPGIYQALVKPAKRLPIGSRLNFGELSAEIVEAGAEGLRTVRFTPFEGLNEKLAAFGEVPLPPYIHEALADRERYQTVYGISGGSAAAPTAGLHFTMESLAQLQAMGVQTASVTLHVGIDTFRPVSVESLADHKMHGERCEVPAKTAQAVAACQGRIIAVGTTTVRTLESFATGKRQLSSGQMRSNLFIRNGTQFQIVDGMFTNFHLPRTTMMVMISALAGRDAVMRAYAEAIEQEYRFLSFGDSMLIL